MYFVFVFHVVTLANLLMPIHQLYFQISNCNVFVYVTLAYLFQISIVTVLNCSVFCHRVSLKHTPKKKGRAFRNIGKYTSQTVKSALHFFFLDYLFYNFFADYILHYRIRCFYFVVVVLANTVNHWFLAYKPAVLFTLIPTSFSGLFPI